MVVYAVSGAAYLAFVVYGYRAAAERLLSSAGRSSRRWRPSSLVVWITAVNLLYLLMQIAIAVDDVGLADGVRGRRCASSAPSFANWSACLRRRARDGGGRDARSALAWSGVGLIAFVPLVGLAVFPLQIAALLVRGLVFEYLGLTALARTSRSTSDDASRWRRPAPSTVAPGLRVSRQRPANGPGNGADVGVRRRRGSRSAVEAHAGRRRASSDVACDDENLRHGKRRRARP